MSSHTSSRVVARGAIRVDARRAAAKLREHLLVDLESYTLEIARAAVALGAKRLSIRHDSDDVVLAFDGRAPAPARLGRLLDFALSESDDPDEKALRTLAIGVNAALGLDPSHVEVASVAGGRAHRVRFSPEVLGEERRSPSAPVETEAPSEAFEHGTVIAVKRGLMSFVRRALAGSRPREIELLAQATHECELEIFENGTPIARDARSPALIRVPISLPGAERARVELLAEAAPFSIELRERGVRLLTMTFAPFSDRIPAGLAIAARVIVDSTELPTNASRSALREDSQLARELAPAAERGLETGMSALAAAVIEHAREFAGVEILTEDNDALREALGRLVANVAKAKIDPAREPELAKLLELPLLKSASGEAIPVRRLLGARSVYAWRQKEGPPEHLGPWLRDVIWLQGWAIERVLENVELIDAKELVNQALLGASRRARLLSHPAGAPVVPASDAELIREHFQFDSGHLSGLEGEVAVLAAGGLGATLRVYVEQRMIEAIRLDPAVCPLSIDAAFAWNRLQPTFGYDGVARDARLSEAILAVCQVAIRLVDRGIAGTPELAPPERAALEQILRSAVVAWRIVPLRLGYSEPKPREFASAHPGLFRAPIWPTTERDRRVSFEDLARYAKKTGAICTVRAWQAEGTHAAADGRPVLIASPDEAVAIAGTLGQRVQVIPYERGVIGTAEHETPAARRATLVRVLKDERARQGLGPSCPVLAIELDHRLVLLAPAFAARQIVCHRGIPLEIGDPTRARASLIIAIDDARVVPTADWNGVLHRETVDEPAFDELLADALSQAFEGDSTARESLGSEWDPESYDPACAVFALELAAALRSSKKFRKIRERLEKAKLLRVLDEMGNPTAASIAEVAEKHGGVNVPVVAEPPGFETLDWKPLIAGTSREREAAQKFFDGAFNAAREIEARQRQALTERTRRELLKRPATSIVELGSRARPDEPRVLFAPDNGVLPGADLEVLVALPHPQLPAHRPSIHVHYMGRPLCDLDKNRFDLPIAGNIDSKSAADFSEWSTISESGSDRIRYRLLNAASELALKCVDAAIGAGAAGRLLNDPRALALCVWLMSHNAGAPLEWRLLGNQFLWPTIQGNEVPSAELGRSGTDLFFGYDRHPSWRTREGGESELDRPILFVPHGEAGEQLLALWVGLGSKPVDVTASAAKLQDERGGRNQVNPILSGMPSHALLRTTLAKLGSSAGDGEIELIEGPTSDLTVVLLSGQIARLGLDLPCPIRVVMRIESIDESNLESRLSPALIKASERFVIQIGPKLDELPRFVRTGARHLISRRANAYDHALDEFPVIEATTGEFHSLRELEQRHGLLYTTLEPPFPSLHAPCIRLSQEEAESLVGRLRAVWADHAVSRRRKAEERRAAPPLTALVLPAEERMHCILTTPFETDGTAGEVGVLTAMHAERRGISLHVTRRMLCRIDDGPGWPLVALVNDDRVEPDAGFMGPNDPAQIRAIVEKVRGAARMAWQRTCQPPATALSSIWLDEAVEGRFRVTGCLWLAPAFPLAPRVRVYTPLEIGPTLRALQVDSDLPILQSLPIEGDLFVRTETADGEPKDDSVSSTLAELAMLDLVWEALGALGARAAPALLADARSRGVVSRAVDETAWNLALLGIDGSPPPARTTGGEPIGADQVISELQRRGAIWLSDGGGWIEGAFPDKTPGFVLADEGPLVRVLETRLHPGTVRRLGGVSTLVPTKSEPVSIPESIPESARPTPRLKDLTAPGDPTWVSRLSRWLGLADDASSGRESPRAARLHQILSDLSLAGQPVLTVIEARAKRPIRYDKKKKRVVISSTHPSLISLFDGRREESEALRLLAAAAVTEINRALQEVNDAEERRVLQVLLADL